MTNIVVENWIESLVKIHQAFNARQAARTRPGPKKNIALPGSLHCPIKPGQEYKFLISPARLWAWQPSESLLTINSKMSAIKQKLSFWVCLVHKRIKTIFANNLVKLPILLTASLMFKMFEVIDCFILWQSFFKIVFPVISSYFSIIFSD